jgi:prolyl 4-hydroxylase
MATISDPIGPVADAMLRHGAQRLPNPRAELFVLRDFLDPERCAALVALIDRDNRPSTIADDRGEAGFRTSKTCDLAPSDPRTVELDTMLSALLGIDPAYGEPLQGQKYEVGNEFRDHTDYFEPNGFDYLQYCAESGQRTWTAMLYCNVPGAGGATRFRHLDRTIQPEVGKLVVWANIGRDGAPNPLTLHAGMKVRRGAKYVITKWYRERRWPT